MLIGLGHVAQVGKSSAAEGLQRDLQFKEISLAEPLKKLALLCDPVINANAVTNVGIGSGRLAKLVASVGGWDRAKVTFPEVRGFLQRLGDGGRIVFGDEFWMEQAFRNLGEGRFVVPDVRYTNEFEAIRAKGGKLIKITRPGHVGQGHVSETQLAELPDSDWDAVVSNDSTVMALQLKITELVREWIRRDAV